MSSIDVVHEAASAKPRVAVVSREMLWEGGIVEIGVSADAAEGVYSDEAQEIRYLMFDRGVKGGMVKCFVHTNNPSCRGEKIKAEISIMRKRLADDRTYLYVDLRPVSRSEPATHRLAIVPNDRPGMWEGYALRFETPSPLSGAIILAEPDAKIVPKTAGSTKPVEKPQPASITGDEQLDRLLAEGWQIESDDGSKVLLSKNKDGKRRELIHHRRKIGKRK